MNDATWAAVAVEYIRHFGWPGLILVFAGGAIYVVHRFAVASSVAGTILREDVRPLLQKQAESLTAIATERGAQTELLRALSAEMHGLARAVQESEKQRTQDLVTVVRELHMAVRARG